MSKRVCRLCLAYSPVCFSLLENNVSEMLEALTSIKVTIDDLTSTITCTKCLLNVKLAYKIQQNILKADKKLKETTLLNSKVEVVDMRSQELSEVKTECISLHTGDTEAAVELCYSNCFICGFKVERSLVTKHVEAHFNDKQICGLCNEECNNIKDYQSHISQKHTQDNNKQVCKTCGAVFRYKSLFNLHINKVHCDKANEVTASERAVQQPFKLQVKKEIEGPYVCNICSKEFDYKRKFMNHTHQRQQCPICKANITKTNFKKHVLNHSSGPQVCELCGAVLKNLESLRGHMAHTHSTSSFHCEECGKVFKRRCHFLLHRKKHNGEKSHICESCGKGFFTLHYLNKHIKTAHLKLRPYVCEYCKKAFSSRFARSTHVRQHTNETPYKCEVCGEGFRQNVSLRAHRKSKHNIIEPKTCACPVCGKLFGSDHAITSHMRLH